MITTAPQSIKPRERIGLCVGIIRHEAVRPATAAEPTPPRAPRVRLAFSRLTRISLWLGEVC